MKAYAKGYACGGQMRPEDAKRMLAKANPGAIVQAARAPFLRNEVMLEMIAAQTLTAESVGALLARRPEVDLLLRLAGTTQISRAIEGHGAREGEPFIAMVAGRTELNGPHELSGLELLREKLSPGELERVEKAALLGAQRSR